MIAFDDIATATDAPVAGAKKFAIVAMFGVVKLKLDANDPQVSEAAS